MSTIKTIGEASPFSYHIQTETETLTGEAVLIFLLNGRFIGTRKFPIPDISVHDGKLDLVIVKNSNLMSFRELMSMKDPNVNHNDFQEIERHQVTRATITTDIEKDVDMDGELYTQTPCTVEILPEHLKMIYPDFN